MIVTLGSVCTKSSSNIRQKDIADSTGKYPIYGASGLIGYVDFYQHDKPYIAVVKDGAGVGRVYLLPAYSSIIGTMQGLIPNDDVLPEYLYYVAKQLHLERHYTGATIPHIYFKDYKEDRFRLVNLSEQRNIVELFRKIESIIDSKQKVLNDLNTLVKARFVEMFGDPITQEHVKDSDIVQLGEVCKLQAGIFTKAKTIHVHADEVNCYPCYGGNGIRGYVDNYTHEGTYPIIGRQGALCGNVQLSKGKFRNTEHAVLVTPKVEMETQWLFELLNLLDLYRYHTGAAQPGLSVGTLNKIQIKLPKLLKLPTYN